MALPEQVCTVLTFGGESLPHTGVLSGVITATIMVLVFLFQILIRLLPVAPEIVPVVGAFLGGFEYHKHWIVLTIILYAVVSILIVAGAIPLCTAAA